MRQWWKRILQIQGRERSWSQSFKGCWDKQAIVWPNGRQRVLGLRGTFLVMLDEPIHLWPDEGMMATFGLKMQDPEGRSWTCVGLNVEWVRDPSP